MKAEDTTRKPMLHLGIDATNIRSGGGITHLSQLLSEADPVSCGIKRVTVWGNKSTLSYIQDYSWLVKRSSKWMDAVLPVRICEQIFKLPVDIQMANCDIVFSPGALFLPNMYFIPVVTMSQNMLPFEPQKAVLFGKFSAMRFKMLLIRYLQSCSFSGADGIIFLTNYARRVVLKKIKKTARYTELISHGIESRFFQKPKLQQRFENYSLDNPFKFLYVSSVMPYKHQHEVAYAVDQLRKSGLPVEVKFIGSACGRYAREFKALLRKLDPAENFLFWLENAPFNTIHNYYHDADAFIFASSCENLPNILLEAMAAGLPIACAKEGPIPEVLGEAGVYFNPLRYVSIATALRNLIYDPSLRTKVANLAWVAAQEFSWRKCATRTFEFIANVARANGL